MVVVVVVVVVVVSVLASFSNDMSLNHAEAYIYSVKLLWKERK